VETPEETIIRLKYELAIERDGRLRLLALVDSLQKRLNNNTVVNSSKNEVPHGTTRYNYGCRCSVCKNAAREYRINRANYLSKQSPSEDASTSS